MLKERESEGGEGRKENKEKSLGVSFLVLLNHLVGMHPPIRRKGKWKKEEREGRREGGEIAEIRK